MDELWAAIVVVEQSSGGKALQALYARAGDEPGRPVRRRLAAALRWLAARLAPLPAASADALPPTVDVATPLQPAR
jgi:hypothetical protein